MITFIDQYKLHNPATHMFRCLTVEGRHVYGINKFDRTLEIYFYMNDVLMFRSVCYSSQEGYKAEGKVEALAHI